MKIEEFNIPMPWGHIAVKAWGDSSDKPVLVTHGGMDNAGSFDGLIPLLSKGYYYICLDLPSHGRSSHLPSFFPIKATDYIIVYKLVLDYFKRGKYILLGHSFGAGVGQYFARFYPQYVEKIIGIDCIVFQSVEPNKFKDVAVTRYDMHIDLHHKITTSKKSTYTKEELIEKVKNSRFNGPITNEGARSIADRNMTPVGNGRYTITLDPRLRYFFMPLHDVRYITETFKLFPITCPYLIILAEQSPLGLTLRFATLEEAEKWGKTKVVYLDYGHDVHITHPEVVAPHINDFLSTLQDKL